MDVFGLIGYPLEHSFSKKYFTEKFKVENIPNVVFELFPLKSVDEFPNILAAVPSLKGLAVTIPYKVAIIPYLSELTEPARAIGAVNCIQILPGKLIGHNTDVIGFEKSLLSGPRENYRGALILGNGGAAKAVSYAFSKAGIPYLFVTREKPAPAETIHYSQLSARVLNKYPMLINCTPVGMHPYEKEKPIIPYHLLSSENFLYDLIYNPTETLFLQEGRLKGCAVKNGLEMLCLQADENWKIWSCHNT